ncbi:MAG: glycerol-3-phosphate dehydrogenase [Pseudomonadota bacterium]
MSNTAAADTDYDLFVIGGGINGVGIARDAAGRGLKTCLAEMNDLASATSSWSTKLIHGGLRYLEQYDFKLVRESLIEREILLDAAPHLIEPLRFVLPHHKALRPAWLLRLGLFLYDNLGGRRLLPKTSRVDLENGPFGAPLQDQFVTGFEYSDCRADDARLVVVNAIDAAERGADIWVRTRFVGAEREKSGWAITLEDARGQRQIRAKAIVNAAGPWVTQIFAAIDEADPTKGLRLVKGSHIFTRRLYDHDRAYIFQHGDGRIVFTIPYGADLTLIGTTDEAFEGDPAEAKISDEETHYLCDLVSAYLKTPITPADVVSTYSGVRPLFDELGKGAASKVTRDYAFDLQGNATRAPLLSIYGGKLTTYRKLALDAMEALEPFFPAMGDRWTHSAHLPGGEMGYQGFSAFEAEMEARYGFLSPETRQRMAHAYGSRIYDMLGDAASVDDLGRELAPGVYEKELIYLRDKEWARTGEDALNRRSKLYLRLSEEEQRAVANWFAASPA